MKRLIFAVLILSLVMLACGSSAPTLKTTDDFIKEFGGNPDVYDRLLSMTDCSKLQDEFDIADENKNIGYMSAADQRMKEIGCYDNSNASQTTFISSSVEIIATSALESQTPFVLPTLTQAVMAVTLPTSEPTNTVVFILPTDPPSSGGNEVCSCSGDTFNCSDFSTQSNAQACMDHCVSIGAGDIHNLDGDADGVACQSLP
jgi:hypothetical protein